MNQYRVSLWMENQGDIPDVDLQFQVVNAVPKPDELVMAAFFLAGKRWARLVEVEAWNGSHWFRSLRVQNVSLNGTSDVWFSGGTGS
jgi:hypothetical protein